MALGKLGLELPHAQQPGAGPLFGNSIGSLTAWRYGAFATLIALRLPAAESMARALDFSGCGLVFCFAAVAGRASMDTMVS